MMIDTHTHLFSEEYKDDIDDVINRAKQMGVGAVVLPNIDVDTVAPMMQLYNKYPKYCYPTIGLHPTSVKENYKDELKTLKDELEEHKDCVVGVGEIGVDLYWDKTFMKEQLDAFRQQIEWAINYNLPIIIHTRDAFHEVVEVMETYKGEKSLKGVFHSFTGSLEEANKLLEYDNFMLGINGVATFKNSNLIETVKHIPTNRLLLETDSPYLTPVPYRGRRNESSYLSYVAEKISLAYGISIDEVKEITTQNTLRLFDKVRPYT